MRNFIIVIILFFLSSCYEEPNYYGWVDESWSSPAHIKRLYLSTKDNKYSGGVFIFNKYYKPIYKIKLKIPDNNSNDRPFYIINNNKIVLSNVFILYTCDTNGSLVSMEISTNIAQKLFGIQKGQYDPISDNPIYVWEKYIKPRL